MRTHLQLRNDAFLYRLQTDFKFFAKWVASIFEPGKEVLDSYPMDYLCDYLEACRRRELKQLLIAMPPRFGKSTTINIAFPAWCLGKNPSEKIATAYYSFKLGKEQNLLTRTVLEQHNYSLIFPETEVLRDQRAKDYFKTTLHGCRFVATPKGSVTGFGFDVLTCDDIAKPHEATNSDLSREQIKEFVDKTFLSRTSVPPTNTIKIFSHQRLVEDDLIGYILAKEAGWQYIELPVEFLARTTIVNPWGKSRTFQRGELVWPEGFPREALDTVKKNLKGDTTTLMAQYYNIVTPNDGVIFKMNYFKFYNSGNIPRNFDAIVHSWDTAVETGNTNDYSACTVWGIYKNGYYLLDIIECRLETARLLDLIKDLFERDSPKFIFIEGSQHGKALLSYLWRDGKYNAIEVKVSGRTRETRTGESNNFSKASRASSAAVAMLQGKVYIPEEPMYIPTPNIYHRQTLEYFLHQLKVFPNGKHDDLVDSAAHFLNEIYKYEKMINQDPEDLDNNVSFNSIASNDDLQYGRY